MLYTQRCGIAVQQVVQQIDNKSNKWSLSITTSLGVSKYSDGKLIAVGCLTLTHSLFYVFAPKFNVTEAGSKHYISAGGCRQISLQLFANVGDVLLLLLKTSVDIPVVDV
jgi:hypothetical protein